MNKTILVALASEFKSQVDALKGASGNCLTPDRAELALNVIRDAIAGTARVASQHNPRFDKARFLAACGI